MLQSSTVGMGRRALVVMWACGLLVGCEVDCDNPARLDGRYVVWSSLAGSEEELGGQNLEDYPRNTNGTYQGFFNGWSVWDLEYLPSVSAFSVYINDQHYQADYTADPDNCNLFRLAVAGVYTNIDATTSHNFHWEGDVAYHGSNLGGTFYYQDYWSSADGLSEGSILFPVGQLTASLNNDETDTGL